MSGPKNLKKGELLFRENDPSEAMYVIKSGKIAIVKAKGTSEITLAELGPGDMLGEMAFFDNKPRSAGARAIADGTVVIELPFKALNAQFKTFPEWLKAVVRSVNNHLRNANVKIKQFEKSTEEETAFFPPHMMTRLVGILAMVAARYGEKKPDGIEVPPGMLRRYTIQVFQQPTAKMQKLMEILQNFKYMTVEDLGEGRQRVVIQNLEILFGFVEFYNDYLFKDESKRITVAEKEIKTIKGLVHYGKKTPLDDKGKLKLNLTKIQAESQAEIGYQLHVDDIDPLTEKGLVPEKRAEEAGITLTIELAELDRLYPLWEIVYALKNVPART